MSSLLTQCPFNGTDNSKYTNLARIEKYISRRCVLESFVTNSKHAQSFFTQMKKYDRAFYLITTYLHQLYPNCKRLLISIEQNEC